MGWIASWSLSLSDGKSRIVPECVIEPPGTPAEIWVTPKGKENLSRKHPLMIKTNSPVFETAREAVSYIRRRDLK